MNRKTWPLWNVFFKYLTADTLEKYVGSERQPINARLRAVCGEDLTKYDKRLANSVQRIVKRGKIRNDSEYEKVRTYIGCIECEPEPSPEHEELLQDLYQLVDDIETAVGDDPSLIGEEWKWHFLIQDHKNVWINYCIIEIGVPLY